MGNQESLNKIVFFDGYCILCNRTVDFLLKNDYKKVLKFSSLQSKMASSIMKLHMKKESEDPGTVYFYDNGQIYTKSAAILKILSNLRQPYPLLSVFRIIPGFMRDWFYDYVSKNRYRWFGRREYCRMPDVKTKGRIL